MSLVDFELVPEAKSFCSTKATVRPLLTASKAIPAPVIPPPITRRSKFSLSRLESFLSRYKLENESMLIAFLYFCWNAINAHFILFFPILFSRNKSGLQQKPIVDAHLIPARGEEPVHTHFDLGVGFQASGVSIGPIDEVLDARWVRFDELVDYEVDEALLGGARTLRAMLTDDR